jgi:endonuclease/exonuclease/phosphatase family metal-dependent hydrolase
MIKVMTFNIRYSLAEDGENCWDKRKPLAIARIHAFDPDLLGIQECRDDAQADFVKRSLPAFHFHGVRREGGGEDALEMAPTLFRTSTFWVVENGHFWLSETPHVAGSKSWGSVYARTATWARLVHQPSGRSIVFLNTHFDYQPTAIDEAARLLRKWLEEFKCDSALIVTGDFNADKNSAAYQLLTGDGTLFDAYRQVHSSRGNEATFHGFGKLEEMSSIDWILVSDQFRVVDAMLDQSHEGSRFPSDHYPVAAVLDWRGD